MNRKLVPRMNQPIKATALKATTARTTMDAKVTQNDQLRVCADEIKQKFTREEIEQLIELLRKQTGLTTLEVALLVDVSPVLLSKWKHRGYLKLAPKRIKGRVDNHKLYWSIEAVEEALQWMQMHRPGRELARARRR